MQRRLSIGRAILNRPSLLLLDEPETGLDQHALSLLEEVLAEAGRAGRTVIMTTHDLHWGLKKGERVIILAEGRVVFDASKPVAEPAAIESAYEEFVARGARA
jgi:heme exporter protein A